MYVTAVDLTDPSGNANVSVSCIPAASGCPVLVENEQVVLAASVIVTCTTNPCTVTGNAITVNDPTLLRRGMYLNLGTNTSPDFGVIGELANNVGSQDVPFVKLPASSTFPLALQFFRPTGIQFWIPAVNATPKLREEKIFVTQGG